MSFMKKAKAFFSLLSLLIVTHKKPLSKDTKILFITGCNTVYESSLIMGYIQYCACQNNQRMCKCNSENCADILPVFQMLTSARMEVTCVATLRSVRTQSEVMVVFVPEVTDPRE